MLRLENTYSTFFTRIVALDLTIHHFLYIYLYNLIFLKGMMIILFCPSCGKESVEGTEICSSCGTKLTKITSIDEDQLLNIDLNPDNDAPITNISPTEVENPQVDRGDPLKNELFPDNTNPTPTSNQVNDYWALPIPKRIFGLKKIIAIPIIAILLVIIIVSGLFITSTFSGPITSISKACLKTYNAGSFNFNGKIGLSSSSVSIDGTLVFDLDNHILEFYAKIYENNNQYVYLLKDGILYQDECHDVDTDDINEDLNNFFDEYDKNKDIIKMGNIDWDKIFELLSINNNNVDTKLFNDAFNNFISDLNDADYINDYLGEYSRKKEGGNTIYSFDINAEKLSKELVSVFGSAFTLKKDFTLDMAQKEIEDSLMVTGGPNFNLQFTTTSNYLSGFSFDANNYYLDINIKDFGNAKIDISSQDLYSKYLS